MKQKYTQRLASCLLAAVLFVWPAAILAVDCSSDNIILDTQAEVDSFQAVYGPCDTVTFSLHVGASTDITNLDGLSGLIDVSFLALIGNSSLTDITGLSSLMISEAILVDDNALSNLNGLSGPTQLSGGLTLVNNPGLSDLSALSGLTTLGGLTVGSNDALANLDSLSGLTLVTGDINIHDNAVLTDISGLGGASGFGSINITQNPQLTSLNGLQGESALAGLIVEDNDALTDLDPLAGLSSVGSLNPEVRISDNDGLTNVDGLASLISVDADFTLRNNPVLGTCGALSALLDDIDDGAAGPGPGAAGIPDINGDVTISFNAMGCNSVPEIVGGGGPMDCAPNDITLTSQAEVDDFQTNHGPCDRIAGFLTVSGGDVVNLDGLASITEIAGGDLSLTGNDALTDTSGLADLTQVSAYLRVTNNAVLASLDGLSNLHTVGTGIVMTDNALLQNITGLSSISGTGLDLQVARNPQLTSLNGLQGISDLGGLILDDNDALPDVDPLAGVTAVDNLHGELTISGNGALANLDGLSSLVSVNSDVGIRDNPMLSDCSALATLMDDVDDALPGPGPGAAGIPDINGDVDLQNNLTGCNSVAEILAGGGPMDCTPDDITLSSQTQVDDFQSNNGPCDRVTGTLTINGADIANLAGLASLTSVNALLIQSNPILTDTTGLSSVVTTAGPVRMIDNGALTNLDGLSGFTDLSGGQLLLQDNPNLSNLSGLSGLAHISATLVIENNDALLNLNDLSALSAVDAGITIVDNDVLADISVLSGLVMFDSDLRIEGNPQLINLNGLQGVSGLDSLVIRDNDSLTNVDELTSLARIGNTATFTILGNANLLNLDGLFNLISVDTDLSIRDNPVLDDCSALSVLLDQTDDGAPGPGPGPAGIPDLNGDVELLNNLTGCNSVAEITGMAPGPSFLIIPELAGLDTHVGFQSIVNPDMSCDWDPGETVQIRWDHPDVVLSQLMVDENGCFAVLIKLDEGDLLSGSLPGPHFVRASGGVSGTSVQPFEQVEPQLHLSPPSGPPRREIMASGCNWGSGEQVEVLDIGTMEVIALLTADGSGCLAGTMEAPDGRNEIIGLAANGDGGGGSGAAYHAILPSVHLPPEGPPETPVLLQGCNWFPDEAVEFSFTYNNVVFDTAGTDEDGCFTTLGPTDPTLFIPPWADIGEQTIRARGMNSNLRVNVPFNVVERTLDFDPPNGGHNDPVLLSGCGWVGNNTVTILWGDVDSNGQPITWVPSVDPDTGCFGLTSSFQINVPPDSNTGTLSQTATGDAHGEITSDFIVNHNGTITIPDPNGSVGQSMTIEVRNAKVGEVINFGWAGPGNPLGFAGAATANFSVDVTLPQTAYVGSAANIHASSFDGFIDTHPVNVIDISEIEVVSETDIPTGTVAQVQGRHWAAEAFIDFQLRQGVQTWDAGGIRVPAGQNDFSAGVVLPPDAPAGDYVLEASENFGRFAETSISLTPGPTPAMSLAASYAEPPPALDGKLSPNEWDYEQNFELENGFISVRSDETRLYILLDMLDDTTSDPGDDDNFWLTFDTLNPNEIDPGFDLNYRLEAGQLIVEVYSGPGTFDPTTINYLHSAYASGFGCYRADGSRVLFPTSCSHHRVFEIAIDLAEISAEPGDLVRFGLRAMSQTPIFTEDYPPDFPNDFTNLGIIQLAPSQADSAPPDGTLLDIGSGGFDIEVTQAIQDVNNSASLVAHKDTVARVYPQLADEGLITAYLFGRRGGNDLPGSPLVKTAVIPDVIDRAEKDHTVNFLLPGSWTADGITELTAIVYDLADPNPEVHVESFQFLDRPVPTYWLIDINSGNAATPELPDQGNINLQKSYLETAFPVAEVDWVHRDWRELLGYLPMPEGSSSQELGQINTILNLYYESELQAYNEALNQTGVEPFTFPDQIHGFASASGYRGKSDRIRRGGAGYVGSGTAPSNGATILAHEINHNFDRLNPGDWGNHTTDDDDDTDNSDWGCGAKDWNFEWETFNGPNDEIGEVGFDTRRPWTDSGTDDVSVVPDNWPDFMSYCASANEPNGEPGQRPRKWQSVYRWNKNFSWIQFASGEQLDTLTATEPVYYLSGVLNLDGTGSLNPAQVMQGSPSSGIEPGDFELEIQNAAGMPLLTVPFHASFEPQDGIPPDEISFFYRLPEQVNAARVVLRHLGMVLDMIEASPNPPSVEITAPVDGEDWSDGLGIIEWTAADMDADELVFSLFYSPDAGMRWFPIARGLTDTQYFVNAWQLPAGDLGRIMLVATDGFHTAMDESAGAFSVPPSPPSVIIEYPLVDQLFKPSDRIELRGRASLPGGISEGLEYAWFLNGQFLELGKETSVVLEEGIHSITLMAWEGANEAGEASVEVNVYENDPPNVPDNPFPADGASEVSLDVTTSWTGGDIDLDQVTYDVYLEVDNPAPATLICDDTPISMCTPSGALDPGAHYYWRVVADDGQGLSSEGEVWEFTTMEAPPADQIYADGFE